MRSFEILVENSKNLYKTLSIYTTASLVFTHVFMLGHRSWEIPSICPWIVGILRQRTECSLPCKFKPTRLIYILISQITIPRINFLISTIVGTIIPNCFCSFSNSQSPFHNTSNFFMAYFVFHLAYNKFVWFYSTLL